MKTAYDLKSFLVGVLLTVLVVLTLGATKDESPQVSRFRVETNRNHVFVVDTVTGQVSFPRTHRCRCEKTVVKSSGQTLRDF